MLLMVRMTPTCVVTQMLVPRMDLGAIPLTLRFDGSTATYPAALQEVLFRFWFCKILKLKKDKFIVTPKDILCQQTHKEKLKKYTDSSITSFLYSICFSFLSCFLTGLLSFLSFPIPRSHPSVLPSSLPPTLPPCLPLFLPFFSRSLSPFLAPPILTLSPSSTLLPSFSISVLLSVCENFHSPVPSDGPRFLRGYPLNSTAIHISWELIPPRSHNGKLLGYRIRYRRLGSQLHTEKNVTSNSTKVVISRLDFRTSYEIKVNGFNEVGHGPPGNLIILETLQKGEHMQSGSALLAFLFCI